MILFGRAALTPHVFHEIRESIIRTLRQFFAILSMMFWQGGFMFYGGVVVPVGSHVLGSDTQQGFITQSVTNYLNLAGFVCLIVWTENLWRVRQRVSKIEWVILAVEFALLATLAVVHFVMDQVLDAETNSVVDYVRFGLGHKIYISVSSVQWLLSLLLLFLTIKRWNRPTNSEFTQ